MRIFIRVFWITAFLLATFSWMVLFQHGFSVDKFTSGVRHELTSLGILPKAPAP
jgi:ABC-type spermidine/putrescine transport system permease subunit I